MCNLPFSSPVLYWGHRFTQTLIHCRYNYSREDEEIYKEFLEVANEIIPNIVKVCSDYGVAAECGVDAGLPLLQDPEVYGLLLQFYDGICEWEEGSQTPVLHTTWAKHLCFSLNKFECGARENLVVEGEGVSDEESEKEEEEEGVKRRRKRSLSMERDGKRRKEDTPMQKMDTAKFSKILNNNDVGLIHSDSYGMLGEEQIKSAIKELASKVGEESDAPNPTIAALAHACGESILNPEFLLNGGEPFTTSPATTSIFTHTDVMSGSTEQQAQRVPSCSSALPPSPPYGDCANGSQPLFSDPAWVKADSSADLLLFRSRFTKRPDGSLTAIGSEGGHADTPTGGGGVELPRVKLHSSKMKGMRRLLVAEKLNASAIKLQLTAQSQVHLKHSKVASYYDCSPPGRRSRWKLPWPPPFTVGGARSQWVLRGCVAFTILKEKLCLLCT